MCRRFLQFRTRTQYEIFQRLQLQFGRARLDAQLARLFVQGNYLFQRRTPGKYGYRTTTQLGLEANDGLSRKVGNEEASEHGRAGLRSQVSGFRSQVSGFRSQVSGFRNLDYCLTCPGCLA